MSHTAVLPPVYAWAEDLEVPHVGQSSAIIWIMGVYVFGIWLDTNKMLSLNW